MSIQDDIFDVEHALENDKDALRAYRRLVEFYGRMEHEVETLRKFKAEVVNGLLHIKNALKGQL